jgi:alpha-tubulin suppressor-like RCC1 family protein
MMPCTNYTTPINMNAAPAQVVDWSKLTSEWQYQYDSLMFITKSGKVYGAGRNVYGKLGNGITGSVSDDYRTCYTREFILPSGVTAVSLSTRDEFSTYVLGSDGNLYASGRNDNGQLGIGNTTSSVLTPVKVLLPIDSQQVF